MSANGTTTPLRTVVVPGELLDQSVAAVAAAISVQYDAGISRIFKRLTGVLGGDILRHTFVLPDDYFLLSANAMLLFVRASDVGGPNVYDASIFQGGALKEGPISIKPSVANTWESKNLLVGPGNPVFSAQDELILEIAMVQGAGDTFDLGPVILSYDVAY